MDYTNFSSSLMRYIYVKVHLFSGKFSLINVYIPSDWYPFIYQGFKEKHNDVPIIPLSFYLYLLRFRKKFLKYVKDNKHDNFL